MTTARPLQRTQTRHSILTLAAVGFLAYYITVMWHEVVGHGSAFYLLGARHFILTSTNIDTSDSLPSFADGTAGSRFVSAAGALANILLGLVLYPVLRAAERRGASLTLRVFLWLLVAVGIYIGVIYPAYSGAFGVGDFDDFIVNWPHRTLIRIFEVVFGSLLCAGVVRFFATSFGEFPESLTRLAWVPYIAAAVIFCVAGLRIPHGLHLMIISVIPAALLGQSILVFVAPVARRVRKEAPPQEAIPISPIAIVVALVFVVVVLLTAPGVHFTAP
jgi:hypothetical protein